MSPPELTEAERDTITALLLGIRYVAGPGSRETGMTLEQDEVEALAKYIAAPDGIDRWTCFHCGDTFFSKQTARAHFGDDLDSAPACKIKGSEGGLLEALRRAENDAADAWAAVHEESAEGVKAMRSNLSRHAAALRSAEETGYTRGLADGRAEQPTPSHQREVIAAIIAPRAFNANYEKDPAHGVYSEWRSALATADRIIAISAGAMPKDGLDRGKTTTFIGRDMTQAEAEARGLI